MTLTGFKAQNHPQQTASRGARDAVDDRGTDRAFFATIEERFGGFTLDVAASAHNAKCDRFYTIEDDGLVQPWHGSVWCNPPYSDCGAWVRKAWLEWSAGPENAKQWHNRWKGNGRPLSTPDLIVMLLPANRVEQAWWQDLVEPYRDRPGSPLRVEFLRGRLRFDRPDWTPGPKGDRPPFGCCLLIWDLVTLYHGDCLTITEWLAAGVLVTDPPYGMDFRSNQRKGVKLSKVAGDADTATRDAALTLWGTERPALVFGRWSVPAPAGERQRLIWAKGNNPGMGDLTIPWGPSHEDIHLLGRGWDREATGMKRAGSVITTHSVRGGSAGEENAWGHPTPKPVSVMEALLSRCPDGLIADPFAGSGATVIAARNLGRSIVAVELEAEYCDAIVRRLSVTPRAMFTAFDEVRSSGWSGAEQQFDFGEAS